MKKRFLPLLLIIALVVTLFAACGESGTGTPAPVDSGTSTATPSVETPVVEPKDGPLLIGVSMNSADEFRSSWLSEFKSQAAAKGYTIVDTNADNSADKQISDIESLIQQDVDIAVVHAFSADGIIPALDALSAASIPVVLVDFPVASDNYNTIVADLQFSNGVVQGEFVNEWLAEDPTRVANVGYIVGSYSAEGAMPRMDGFFETATTAVKLVEGEGGWSADGAMGLTEDWLQAYPEMNVFVAMSDEMALGSIQALKAAGINLDDVLILGIDGSDEGKAAIRSGELDCTSSRDIPKEALTALDAAERIMAGETLPKEVYPEAISSLTSKNID